MKTFTISVTSAVHTKAVMIKKHYGFNWNELIEHLIQEYGNGKD